jgi:alpha-tubulin suppressor-like RCC1 family protein
MKHKGTFFTILVMMMALVFSTIGIAPVQAAPGGNDSSQTQIIPVLPFSPPPLLVPGAVHALGTPALPMSYNITAVAAGGMHTCALTSSGGVKCWGYNGEGQLGDGTTMNRLTAVDVSGLSNGVSIIAAGYVHTCALTPSGGVKCWGNNWNGQLGDGTLTNRSTPVDVSGLTGGVVAIATGMFHTCALTTSGGVQCWGDNQYGQLGDGTSTERHTPVIVSGLTSGVSAIATRAFHTCALMAAGGVKCWGWNEDGQLGDGTTINRATPMDVSGLSNGVSAITTGWAHTCALTTAGGVKCWGSNWIGQLGDGTTTNSPTPVEVSGLTGGVSSIAAGYGHTCALMTSGDVQCWGDNGYGQLGDGTTTERHTPVNVSDLTGGVRAIAAGGDHTCALTSSGGLKCWGHNLHGRLGDGTTIERHTPVDVSRLTNGLSAVAAGWNHTCALTTTGSVKCWGYNEYGQLGDGTTTERHTPVDVSGLSSGVSAIAAGVGHTCALTTSGGVRCWGFNGYGQLGDGTATDSYTPVDVNGLTSGVSAIAASLYHTCALTTAGGLKCWGNNAYGQLGDGTTTDRYTPVDVSGLTSGVNALAVGIGYTCALTTDGGAKCWGGNWYGQLGDGTITNSPIPLDVSGLASGVSAITAGEYHTCALTTIGGLKCWGGNFEGQLGDGTSSNYKTTPVDVSGMTGGVSTLTAGGRHTCALTTGGVQCWGYNFEGQLGNGTTTDSPTPVDVSGLLSGVSAIMAGGHHTCALTAAGGLKCWGWNAYGQLGDGTSAIYSTTPVQVSGLLSSALPNLALSLNPASYGQALHFTATLLSAGGTPGGTVQFTVDGIDFGAPVSLVSGSATSAEANTLSPGAHLIRAVYSGDTNFFSAASAGVVQIVTQATPVITWSNPANIVYGTPLSATQLNATADTPGTFTYTPALGTILNTGTHTLHVDFVPTDTVNYANASKDVSITVTKATPVITWSNPATIVYGTALSATQLNATANTPGTFTYTPASGTVLNVGTHTLHVDFTPTDTANYANASKDVSITITKAAPVITWANPADIDQGTPLSDTQLNATANVPGSFTYTPAAGATLSTGTHTLHVDFTPTDTANYANASADVSITVIDHVLFADVPDGYWARLHIERLYLNQITGGCANNPLRYCPTTNVNRAMMAVFVLRAAHGPGFTPPAASGTVFADVPADGFAAAWIEQLAAEGITGGCGGGNYCPNKPVTRAQMAVFLVKAMYGTAYTPPAAGGDIFGDVPADGFAAAFIEQLVADGITGGCGGGNFCPNKYITRAEMAVFLVGAFDLP